MKPNTSKQLEKLLEIREINDLEKTQMLSIFEKKRESVLLSSINNLLEIDKLFNLKLEPKNLRVKLYKLYNQRDQSQIFLSLLSESLVAIQIKNEKWLERSIIKLIKLPTEMILAELSSDTKSTSAIIKILPKVLQKIKENLKDKQIYNFLILHLSPLLKSSEQLLSFFEENNHDFSFSQINDLSTNRYYRGLFPLLWYNEIKKRSSRQEAQEYILKLSKEMKWRDFTNEDLFLLRYIFPKTKKNRDVIVKKILKLSSSNLISHHFLLETLLQDKIIKKELSLTDKTFKRPSFLILRRRFLRTLKQAYYIDFSLFQLFKLGNYSQNLLLWKLL